jgi:hypothetical protein
MRTVMQGNLTLSQMADQKANMVIGASFVIFTLSVGQMRAGTMLSDADCNIGVRRLCRSSVRNIVRAAADRHCEKLRQSER